MSASEHQFSSCQIDVVKGTAPDPENPEEQVEIFVLRILNPHQAETYLFPMTDELRAELVRQLTGGVVMATSVPTKKRLH